MNLHVYIFILEIKSKTGSEGRYLLKVISNLIIRSKDMVIDLMYSSKCQPFIVMGRNSPPDLHTTLSSNFPNKETLPPHTSVEREGWGEREEGGREGGRKRKERREERRRP